MSGYNFTENLQYTNLDDVLIFMTKKRTRVKYGEIPCQGDRRHHHYIRYYDRLLPCSTLLDTPVVCRLETDFAISFSVTKLLFFSSWVDICKTKIIYCALYLPPLGQKRWDASMYNIWSCDPFQQKKRAIFLNPHSLGIENN